MNCSTLSAFRVCC